MKKTTKKLISIFLSLLMVLSLIPTGMITAFAAATVGDCYFCGHSLSSHKTTGDLVIVGDTQVISSCSDCGGQSECVGKTWALAIEGDDNPMNNPEAHECSYTTSTHYMITTNGSNFRCKQYAYDSTREKWFVDSKLKSIANAKFPEGASAGDGKFYIENPESAGTYIECADDYVDFTTTHYYCELCQMGSSSFISNDDNDVAEHIWTAHDGDMNYVMAFTHECGDAEYLCGDPECPNTPAGPTTPDWVDTIVSKVDAVSEDLFNEEWGVSLKGYLANTDFDSLDSLVSDMEAPEYSQEGSVYTIEGETTYGDYIVAITLDEDENIASVAVNYAGAYTVTFTPAPAEPNWTPITIEGKDYLYDANILKIDTGNLVCSVCNDFVAQTTYGGWYTTYPVSRFTNCVAAGHIKEAPCGLCVGCGHEQAFHYGGHCFMCWSAESGSCESKDNYTACALEKGHSGDHSATATTGPTPLTFTAEESGSSMTFAWYSGSDVQIKASSTSVELNGESATGDWQDYTANTAITFRSVGDSVQFKGTNVTTGSKRFIMNTGKIAASGDVTSLTNGVGGDVELTASNCYSYMFYNCRALTSAPNLPSTTLAKNCYLNMFKNSTNLTTVPELPATALAENCYGNMFDGCTSLTTTPELPATELAPNCYRYMFNNCTGLTSAPELKATQLATNCYGYMFSGCTGLTTSPELKATKLADNCYSGMFNGCTSLTTAPELPATELARSCYNKMFSGCTGLTSVPELKATVLADYCYGDMFSNCTGLRVVETDKQSEATWIIPAEVTATGWNNWMLDGLKAPGTLKAVEVGKMYKVTTVCGMCTECGHSWAKHDPVGDCCSLCPVGDGCFDEILGEQCVLDAGHDGNHDSWLTITNTDDINAILTKVVGEFKDAEYPDDYSIKISGNTTDGFSYVYNDGGSEVNAVFVKAKQKGNEVFVEFNYTNPSTHKAGFTFVFDSQGKLTNCYQVGYKIGGLGISNYYGYPYVHVHTWDNGTCTLDGTTCSHTFMTTSDATCGTCGITNPSYVSPHTHTFATTWSSDATQHWYAATCEHTTEKSSLGNHSGGTATCTAAAVCSTCGASYGTALGHSFATEWSKDSTHHWHAATCGHDTEKSGYAQHSYTSEVTTNATCTSAGVTTYTCECGDTYTDTTAPAALGHNFTNYIPNNNATCTADGTKTAVCDRNGCGVTDTITDEGTATGHSFATEWSKDATHHWHAATCGHTDQKSGYAQHSYTSEVTTNATCTSAGVTTYTCTCGDTYTDTTAPAALGHSFTNYIPNNNATCTADGTKTATCDRTGCSVTNTITDEGTATGHTYATTWSSDENQHWYAATCEHNTLKKDTANHTYGTTGDARFTCTVCSAVNEAKKLEAAKTDAKAAIDAYLGESENEDADAVANKAKQDIDAATTVEDVNDIKAKALEDIKDIIAPDFNTLEKDLKYDGTVTKLTKDYTRGEDQGGVIVGNGEKVIIDLNGHTIDGANDTTVDYSFIFYVNSGGELVINDSTDNKGVITGGTGYYNSSYSRAYGGAIYNNGTLTINGGTFTGNEADDGGVLQNKGTATVNGGVFTNNIAYTQGGAINNVNTDAVLTITGGTFTNNKSGYGAAIENYYGSVATILGGTITDNTAIKNGGAIDNDSATLIIGGSPVIKDNKVGDNTNNVEAYGATIVLDEETALTEDAEIGITLNASTDTIIASGATLDTLKALKSDNATKMFIVDNGAVKIMNVADHTHAGGSATCQVLAICQSCGQSYGELAQHSYTEYVPNYDATCTEDGTKTAACDYECGETDTITDESTATGHSYTSKVTKKATYTEEGVRTYTCHCGDTYNEPIARLKITSTVKYNNSTKLDSNFKVSSTSTNVTVTWGKVNDADGYLIYAGYCTKGSTAKRIMTVKSADITSYTFTKIAGEKIDLTKSLKVYVVAYKTVDGTKNEFGKSITAHIIGGKNKKYSNPTKVTVKNNAVTLSVNKTSTISATVTYKDPSLKHISDSHAAEKRYRSSNKAVATVDANGKITAVGKGTCTIYVFAKNGYPAKVTVTVK